MSKIKLKMRVYNSLGLSVHIPRRGVFDGPYTWIENRLDFPDQPHRSYKCKSSDLCGRKSSPHNTCRRVKRPSFRDNIIYDGDLLRSQ